MGDVTKLHRSEILDTIQDVKRDIQAGKITYIQMMIQREADEFVEWDLQEAGEKSYDPQHLLSQVGVLYLATHSVFNDLAEDADDNDEG